MSMMMQAGEIGVHIEWQYIRVKEIWQEPLFDQVGFSQSPSALAAS